MKINSLKLNNFIYKTPFLKQNGSFKQIHFKRNELLTDVLEFENAQNINDKLLNNYGIHSKIDNPVFLKQFLNAVQDFCSINEDNRLFDGLSICFVPCDTLFFYNNGVLLFDKDFDYSKMGEFVNEDYNDGNIGSAHPLHYFYEALADHLNFEYNEDAFEVNKHLKFKDNPDELSSVLKIQKSKIVGIYNSNYIATRMAGEILPKSNYKYFFNHVGNSDLKFPRPKHTFLKGCEYKFNSTDEASEFLKKEYGIISQFKSINAANACVQAVVDFSKALDDKNIFEGLKIITGEWARFQDTDAYVCTNVQKENKSPYIEINPACDYKKYKEICKEDYSVGHGSTPRPKDVFIHELAHWLEASKDLKKFHKRDKKEFTKKEIFKANKVGDYATSKKSEFCAEYIAGRMAGLHYPKITNEMFEKYWYGPKINFP